MWPGLVGRWAMPSGPKLKKVGVQKSTPPNLGPFGVSCPFLKKIQNLEFGASFPFLDFSKCFFSFIGVGVAVEV
jgi:hypothetical protein